MEDEKYFNLSQKANQLRHNKKYKEALKVYNEMYAYIQNNNINLSEKDLVFLTSGKANCLRNENLKNDYKKYLSAKASIIFLNNFLKNNPDFDLEKCNYSWLKTEFIWSYLGYYLSENYQNIANSIYAAKKIKNLIDNSNEIAYNCLLKNISKKLLTNDIIEKYINEIDELLSMFPYGNKYFIEREYNHSLLEKHIDSLFNRLNNSKKNLTEKELLEQRVKKARENSIISAKFKVLYFKGEYEKIIKYRNKIFDSGEICNVAVAVERIASNAYIKLGDYDNAIEMLENALAEFGKQAYLYKDIANIYDMKADKNKALLNYYKYCIYQQEKDNINNVLLILSEMLDDKKLARKYINLYFLIQEKNNWTVKDEAKLIEESLADYREIDTRDYNELLKELTAIWKQEINKHEETFTGKVIRIANNNKFGFINYLENNEIFFKLKNKNLNVGDNVSFNIEKSYDKSKKVFSQAATNIKIISQ